MADSLAAARAGYILGYDERAFEQLDRQAMLWEAATRRALSSIPLARDANCLDVGCGTGAVMKIIAELAGDAGRVVGLDVNLEISSIIYLMRFMDQALVAALP